MKACPAKRLVCTTNPVSYSSQKVELQNASPFRAINQSVFKTRSGGIGLRTRVNPEPHARVRPEYHNIDESGDAGCAALVSLKSILLCGDDGREIGGISSEGAGLAGLSEGVDPPCTASTVEWYDGGLTDAWEENDLLGVCMMKGRVESRFWDEGGNEPRRHDAEDCLPCNSDWLRR